MKKEVYMSDAEYDALKKQQEAYPSDNFSHFDAMLGIITLAILFIMYW